MKSKYFEHATDPVDPKLFAFAIELFHAAAAGLDPSAHIPKPDPDRPGLYLTNIPINRGMLAVMRETKHLTQDQSVALSARLMEFGFAVDRLKDDPRFAEHIKKGDDEHSLMVSEEFRSAFSQCAFRFDQECMGPDVEDLLRRANPSEASGQ